VRRVGAADEVADFRSWLPAGPSGPAPKRLPGHTRLPAPTTRHDLASVRRWADSTAGGDGGDKFWECRGAAEGWERFGAQSRPTHRRHPRDRGDPVHRPRNARRSCRSCTTAGPDGAMLVVGPEHWLPARRCAASGMMAVGGESSAENGPPCSPPSSPGHRDWREWRCVGCESGRACTKRPTSTGRHPVAKRDPVPTGHEVLPVLGPGPLRVFVQLDGRWLLGPDFRRDDGRWGWWDGE
jgi:hypothetical protein